ncbi:cupredoxin domain-containing protein [Pseudomarimonas arenosa]|uniref:Blue (type 1) copper domain-containing protein n=1 Tax=Pseudomarimonas arenosa TaxID=2774145 RepID=A0AAW3ZI73_9GAMM|nr:plastocyanin/azurin family copper-binding protein [Pseudomarimonas arenosa]MBD8525783.1 hypothetical protein [Pseudomarimonas arenosa]
MRGISIRCRQWSCAFTLLIGCAAATAATHDVTLSGVSFSPRDLLIEVGDKVRWTNQGGFHDVVADDNSFSSGPPSSAAFVFEHTFNSPGEFGYFCSVHGSAGGIGMAGTISVEGSAPPAGPALTRSSSGAWFNPATNGQGLLVEVYPEQNIFTFAWFTWLDDADSDQQDYDWMTGSGVFQGNVATLEMFRSRGGRFNDPNSPVNTTAAGQGSFTLTSCTTALFSFDLFDPQRSGTIELTRILPSGPECQDPEPNP